MPSRRSRNRVNVPCPVRKTVSEALSLDGTRCVDALLTPAWLTSISDTVRPTVPDRHPDQPGPAHVLPTIVPRRGLPESTGSVVRQIAGVEMLKSSVLFFVLLGVAPGALAQQFEFPSAAADDPAVLSRSMPGLAKQVIATYRDENRREYLDNLFRLQIVAGEYQGVGKTLDSLRASMDTGSSVQSRATARATYSQYELFAMAKAKASAGAGFEDAFVQSFREVVGGMDDRTSALAIRSLNTDQVFLKQSLDGALGAHKGKDRIALADALALIRAYQAEWAYRSMTPLTAPLIAGEDRRRYIIDSDIRISTEDGATVCALVMRPRATSGRLPALLNFTIYSDPTNTLNEARRTASNGYVGIEGYTRGKACSPDQAVPYEHDGSDAAAVIDWISRQPWSDGRVGMYGGSYEGFTQWAAAKHMPKALKALMPSVTAAPGIDVPMEGNIVQSFVYYWPFYTTNTKTLDNAPYNDRARWNRMKRQWYVSGDAYRSLDRIDGTPNPFFDRWLQHPAYDAYWQAMIPYRQDFARIDIPVLTTTGYYDDAQIGALYYFIEHHRYHPRADHTLLIGPYDHVGAQRRSQDVLNGYRIDPVARLSIEELRYDWFDYVLKGAAKPALLKDKVNYQVMAANRWKHAPSLAAMSDRTRRFHLSDGRSGSFHRLSEQKPKTGALVTQTIDLADRTDIDRVSPGIGGIVDKAIDTWNAVAFVSEPFTTPTEVSGLFSGHLDFTTNKRDFDFSIGLYELTPAGEYIALSHFMSRASHVADNTRRQLLAPDRPQQLDFSSGRLTSRQFQKGSRLVVLLGVIKDPYTQINYGTGKEVSDETIADAGQPLKIQWSGESFVDIPIAAGAGE